MISASFIFLTFSFEEYQCSCSKGFVTLAQSKETKLMLLDKTDEQKTILKLFE